MPNVFSNERQVKMSNLIELGFFRFAEREGGAFVPATHLIKLGPVEFALLLP